MCSPRPLPVRLPGLDHRAGDEREHLLRVRAVLHVDVHDGEPVAADDRPAGRGGRPAVVPREQLLRVGVRVVEPALADERRLVADGNDAVAVAANSQAVGTRRSCRAVQQVEQLHLAFLGLDVDALRPRAAARATARAGPAPRSRAPAARSAARRHRRARRTGAAPARAARAARGGASARAGCARSSTRPCACRRRRA